MPETLALIRVTGSTPWLGLVVLGVMTGVVEAISAVVFALLLESMTAGKDIASFGLVGDLVTEYFPEQNRLQFFSAAVAAVFLARSGLLLFQTYKTNKTALEAGAQISGRLLRHYLALPYESHLRRNSSELIRNAQESAGLVASSIFVGFVSIISEALIVLALLVVLVLRTPAVALVALSLTAILSSVLLAGLQPRLSSLGSRQQDSFKRSLQWIQETLHGLREIRFSGRERFFIRRFVEERIELARAQYLQLTLASVPRILLETIVVLSLVLLVVLTTSEAQPEQRFATLGLIAYAALRIVPAVSRILTYLSNIAFAGPALRNVQADLRVEEQERELPVRAGSPRRGLFRSSIVLRNVSYRYPGSHGYALHGIALEIRQGEVIGIVGRTGAGKSTLVDVMLGLLPPTEGEILVDGAPLNQNAVESYGTIAMVSQGIYLLDDTLRRNIAFGREIHEIDEDRLRDAVDLAQLARFVELLPDGLDTRVGDRGVRLSGGELQRVGIARSLYADPEVLVLDEGTSALDALTERSIVNAISQFRTKKTVILVAHRLSTVAACDRVILMEAGSVVDVGPFPDLLDRSPELREMSRSQVRQE